VKKSVKQLPVLKKRKLSTKQRNFRHFTVGDIGEKVAKAFLVRKGYTIITNNVVFKKYEIDIVALDTNSDELVFVEVKTRKSTNYGNPSQSVSKRKLRSLKKGAQFFLRYTGLQNFYRFDIIAITPGRVEHFENITWP
jgi:putative endonuclease